MDISLINSFEKSVIGFLFSRQNHYLIGVKTIYFEFKIIFYILKYRYLYSSLREVKLL